VGDPNVKDKSNASADADDEEDEDEMDSEDVLKANLIPDLVSRSPAGPYFPAGGPGGTLAACGAT
jgi:hypothetical protein